MWGLDEDHLENVTTLLRKPDFLLADERNTRRLNGVAYMYGALCVCCVAGVLWDCLCSIVVVNYILGGTNAVVKCCRNGSGTTVPLSEACIWEYCEDQSTQMWKIIGLGMHIVRRRLKYTISMRSIQYMAANIYIVVHGV